MSHSPSPVTAADASLIASSEPVRLPGSVKVVLGVLMLIGVASLVIGLNSDESKVAWASFQVHFAYWFLLGATLTCFSAVLQICNAQWARPLRRIFESGHYFFLYSICPLLVLTFGCSQLFAWYHEPAPGKEAWLTPGFFYTRDIIAMIALWLIANRLVKMSLSRDIGAIKRGLVTLSDSAKERWSHKRYDSLISSWSPDTTGEIKEIHQKMNWLSPAIVVVFSLVMSLVAFDQLMSVDYHWFSTLFGVMYFMAGVYLSVAWTVIVYFFLRGMHPLFRAKVERRTLHDLGKLLFGFGIFWAYMFWSHYLPIWYGNLPEETGWLITRLRLEPWHTWAWGVFGMCFIIPFFLGLSRDVKQVPILLFATALIVVTGVWGMIYLLFVPTIFPGHIPFGLLDVGIGLGFLGGFLLSVFNFLEKWPLMPFGDLLVEDSSHH